MTTTGGDKLRASLRKARQATGVDGVDVGIFSDARYPDGTPVAAVQEANEFGTRRKDGSVHIPERPAVRQAIRESEDDARSLIEEHIDTEAGRADEKLAGLVGEFVKGAVQRSITTLRAPPNAESTIRMKGSSNPLIRDSIMRGAWTWKIIQE